MWWESRFTAGEVSGLASTIDMLFGSFHGRSSCTQYVSGESQSGRHALILDDIRAMAEVVPGSMSLLEVEHRPTMMSGQLALAGESDIRSARFTCPWKLTESNS